MKYVLDASVALKWALAEPDRDIALRLRADLLSLTHEFIAPDVYIAEVAHALTKAERRNIIPPGTAENLLPFVFDAMPSLHSSHKLVMRAVAIASAARTAVYDALYLALAEEQQCELITADQKLIAKFTQFPIIDLASL